MYIDIKCHWCGIISQKKEKEIQRQMRKGRKFFFCSLSCGAKYRNSIRDDRIFEITKSCLFCGKYFDTITGRKTASYCSRSCASKGSMNDFRRIKQREGGKARVGNLLDVTITLKKREAWKYQEIKKLLNFLKKRYEFEYRINNNIFDLALFEEKLLIEFDGHYHDNVSQIKIDRYKEKVAKDSGWNLVRIKTKANTIIPPDTMYALLNRK